MRAIVFIDFGDELDARLVQHLGNLPAGVDRVTGAEFRHHGAGPCRIVHVVVFHRDQTGEGRTQLHVVDVPLGVVHLELGLVALFLEHGQ